MCIEIASLKEDWDSLIEKSTNAFAENLPERAWR
jgi:hypothetical protein